MAECLLFLSYLEEERNEDDEEEEDDECATTEVRFVPADKGACKLSHIMRKPVYTICEQQRRRSACASAQSDQRLCCSLPG